MPCGLAWVVVAWVGSHGWDPSSVAEVVNEGGRWGYGLYDIGTNNAPAAWRRSLPVGGVFVWWRLWSSVKRG